MSASGGREQEKGTTKGREMIAWPVAHSTAPVVQAATAAQPTDGHGHADEGGPPAMMSDERRGGKSEKCAYTARIFTHNSPVSATC